MRPPEDPFLRPDSVRYEDIVADGFVELLRTRGVDGLTMKGLASWMRVTPSAVTHRGRWPATVELFVAALLRRWVQWSIAGLRRVPAVPSVPLTAVERHGVRCWHVAHELARTEAAAGRPAALVAWQEAMEVEEEHLLEWWLSTPRAGGSFDRFRLVLGGTRLALAMDPTLPASAGAEAVRIAASIEIESDGSLNSN
ncbi:hypothetical protein GCM10011584_03490 [Nocardioides phosphati]|uniref:TetR/AcrR family transcriptional regulator n=1 Tax=Nocardioides phosphati TaxID=1867775 RepID=A0ABQ2N537_9ACTN|nr:hypothetical protein [Nocardioides phosphati]GGO84875.1 hypothetical protein GCM10011584_03490 [Nocardioides phosphati]